MDILAEERAKACRAYLIELGVPHAQLFVTARGRGGHISVEFTPMEQTLSLAEIDARKAAASDDELVPLPLGIPYRLRLKAGGAVVFSGVTQAIADVVSCPLPRAERLFVGQEYVFEALPGPGTEPNDVEFSLDPEKVQAHDALEVKLPVRRVSIGQVHVVCKLERRAAGTGMVDTAVLTTGIGRWRMPQPHGPFKAGEAPKTGPHAAWYTPRPHEGGWLGSASAWPPGDVVFTLDFHVNSPELAMFALPYAVDNKLKGATLNGIALDIGKSSAFKTCGGAAVIRAPAGAGLFLAGPNVLAVTVENGGDVANPMGLYLHGSLKDEQPYTRKEKLSTGLPPHERIGEWQLAHSHGAYQAGAAPRTEPHPNWYKPGPAQSSGMWLGSAGLWPPGDVVFMLAFHVNSPELAMFALPYAVDNKLKGATLNGRPLDIGTSRSFATCGGDAVIRAPPGAGLFVEGENVLAVTVENGGQSANPMGLYLHGELHDQAEVAKKARAKAHWSDKLELPQVLYHVLDASPPPLGRELLVAGNGVVHDTRPGHGSLLHTYGLQSGVSYKLQALETKQIAACRPTDTFRLTPADAILELPVRRRLNMVTLEVRSKHRADQGWRHVLKLPKLFEVNLVHKNLGAVVMRKWVSNHDGHVYEMALPYSELLVGEEYVVTVCCTAQTQADHAAEELTLLERRKAYAFADVGDEALKGVEDAWAVNDVDKVLPAVAALLKRLPDVVIEVQAEHGYHAPRAGVPPRAPPRLASYYKMGPETDVAHLYCHVARNRAARTIEALVKLGAPKERLQLRFSARPA
eukprot:3313725-Prymnesium_polylepis.1